MCKTARDAAALTSRRQLPARRVRNHDGPRRQSADSRPVHRHRAASSASMTCATSSSRGCISPRRFGSGWSPCRSASACRTGLTIRTSTSSSTCARSGCPRPGDDAQLGEQVARIHARPLDRIAPAVGDVSDPRPRRWPAGDLRQDASRCDRRRHRRRDPGRDLGRHCRAAHRAAPDEYWHPGPLPSSIDLLGEGWPSTAQAAARHRSDPPQRASASRRPARRRPGPRRQTVSNLADSAIRSAAAGALTPSRSAASCRPRTRRSTRPSPAIVGLLSDPCR